MSDLPIIDIAPLLTGSRKGRDDVDLRIGEAIRSAGVFIISGYPDADKVDARAHTMLRFFDLPVAEKRAVGTREMNPESAFGYRGYVASLKPGAWAYNEFFDIGPDDPSPGPDVPGMEVFAESNQWPVREPVPGWQDAMRSYYAHMRDIGDALMLSAGRAVGFDDEALKERFRNGNSTVRLLNYPRPPGNHKIISEMPDPEESDLALSAGRHTDAAGLSLLWQRDPGLQAQAPDGTWRNVPMIDNCISVHLGTVLEIMTSGRVPATPHRVLNLGQPRQSIGFFLEPALGVPLAAVTETDPETAGIR
ncbi:MAG: isopenicillin N synthase family oxygenase, partial [Caldilineaceae bacterium]|nr:isopenicillin N synthase family oxygenase [Caldilineaceae bacterium]